eukprot:scaffold49993_cov88-Phaeocystis_antarctica.AAC.1
MMCCCFHTALADQRSMRPRACAHIDIQSHTGIVYIRKYARSRRKVAKAAMQAKICTPSGAAMVAKICKL